MGKQMARNWIIEMVEASTDTIVAEGRKMFASPACGVCGQKETSTEIVSLYQKMENHKCEKTIGGGFTLSESQLEEFFN
jgi:hypothetical protein